MDRLPDLSSLSHDEKDALIHALWAQVQALTAQVGILTARVAELEAKLRLPPKTPDNSSLPPSQGKKPNRDDKPARQSPRQGSLGRKGGGRLLAEVPDETVTARPSRCAQCEAALTETDLTLASRFDKVDLPKVVPVVTRGERYAGPNRRCGPPPSSARPPTASGPYGAPASSQRSLCPRNRSTTRRRHPLCPPPHSQWTAPVDCCLNPLALDDASRTG